jgi:glycosyltransferase involved in cell wall biosynthesis
VTEPGPSIAAVLPARRAGETLRQALLSVLTQRSQPDEIIVVDDDGASTLVERLGDPRVRIERGPARGAAAARNVGLRAARADWVAFLDADDTWLDGHIAALRRAIRTCPDAGACFAAAVHVSEQGEVLNWATVRAQHANVIGLLTRRIQPTTSAAAVNRELVLDLGGFDEGFLHPAGVEDIDLWWRIAAVRPCIVQPVPLVRYVVHEARDQARARQELENLSGDRRRCISRLDARLPPRLIRRAAAQHLAIMARYWLVAGYPAEARGEALASLRYAPTGNGLAALALSLLPPEAREAVRNLRRSAIRVLRRPA